MNPPKKPIIFCIKTLRKVPTKNFSPKNRPLEKSLHLPVTYYTHGKYPSQWGGGGGEGTTSKDFKSLSWSGLGNEVKLI